MLTVAYFGQQMHACACVCMVENNGKHTKIMKKCLFHHTHERLRKGSWRKKFVGQPLGVTPKSWFTPNRWLLIWNFVVFVLFSTWASHVQDANKILNVQPAFGSHSQSLPNKLFSSFFFMSLTWALIRMMEKVLFSWFSNVFYSFRPWKHVPNHVLAGQNTQQWVKHSRAKHEQAWVWALITQEFNLIRENATNIILSHKLSRMYTLKVYWVNLTQELRIGKI